MLVNKEISAKISNMCFVCACLVVVLHIYPDSNSGSALQFVDQFISYGIGRLAVPFFCLVSGFFLAQHRLEHGWWHKTLSARIKSLIIPYFIWNAGWVLLTGCRTENIRVVIRMFNPFVQPPLGPLWYIRSLFLFAVISPVLVKAVERFPRLTLGTLFVLYAGLFIPTNESLALFTSFIHLEALFYFSVGLVLSFRIANLNVHLGLGVILAAIFSVAVTMLRIWAAQQGMYVFYPLRALVVPGYLLLMWVLIPTRRFDERLIKCAFPIYLMHCFVILILKKFGCAANNFVGYFVLAVSGVLIPIVAFNFLCRMLPQLANVLFGGRVIKRGA